MPTFNVRAKERRVKVFGRYEVSDQGVVYSDGVPLAAIGGVGVNLGGKRVKIAELVADAFVPGKDWQGRCWVRHKNGRVEDNRACNLEWSGEKEEKKRGRKSVVRLVKAVDLKGNVVGQWQSVREASLATGVGESSIRACLRGDLKSSKNLLWI